MTDQADVSLLRWLRRQLRQPTPEPGAGIGARQAAAMLGSMTIEMVFDLLGVRVDGPRADGESVAIGWRFPDIDEAWTLRLEHGAQPSTLRHATREALGRDERRSRATTIGSVTCARWADVMAPRTGFAARVASGMASR